MNAVNTTKEILGGPDGKARCQCGKLRYPQNKLCPKCYYERTVEQPVSCKISCVATEADLEKWMPADLKPYIDHVIGCFDFGRVVHGGDWSVLTQAIDYPK